MAAKNPSRDELERAGIFVETPTIEVPGSDRHIETVAESDLARISREEAFMNERVTIRVSTTTDPNAPPFCTVTVNSPQNRVQIPRGIPVTIKRMFVEVLARMTETRYSQLASNPHDPEPGNQLIPHHARPYPFEVLADANPLGREWLERVLAEQN